MNRSSKCCLLAAGFVVMGRVGGHPLRFIFDNSSERTLNQKQPARDIV